MSYIQVLAEISQTWSVMSLTYEIHSFTGIPLLKADEILIETLEDNQVSMKIVLVLVDSSCLFYWFSNIQLDSVLSRVSGYLLDLTEFNFKWCVRFLCSAFSHVLGIKNVTHQKKNIEP